MNKTVRDLHVAAAELLRDDYVLLRLIDPTSTPMPPVAPGQFVEVLVSQSATTFLRRPISVNDFLADRGELHLLVHAVGDGTRALLNLKAGDSLNCIFPLGHGFTMPEADAAPSHSNESRPDSRETRCGSAEVLLAAFCQRYLSTAIQHCG